MDGFQRTAQVEKFRLIHIHTLNAYPLKRGAHIEEILVRKGIFFLNNADKFIYLFQSAVDVSEIIRKRHVVDKFFS